MRGLIALIGLSATVTLVASLSIADDVDWAAGSATRGERVYERYCATCHGITGDGNGPTAYRYPEYQPRDLTSGNYRFRTTASGYLPTPADLARTIRVGLPGTSMPAWQGLLDDRAIADVVTYIQTLSPLFAEEAEFDVEIAGIPTSVPPPTLEGLERGRDTYLLMRCWVCHGFDGAASGPQAQALTDEAGQPVIPWDLTSGLFRGGMETLDMYRTLATGLDGTPMPAYLHPMPLFRPSDSALELLLEEMEIYDPGGLSEAELIRFRSFAANLPTPADVAELSESEQSEMIDQWHWDLVHYSTSLSGQGSFWRQVAGIDEGSPLYGAD